MNEPITPESAAQRMREIFPRDANGHDCYDEDGAHHEADKFLLAILRQHGYEEAAEIFDHAGKWYA